MRRKSFYDNLMENPSSDKFYKLIKKSKSSKEASSTYIQIEERKYFDSDEQRGCFAKYFEDLAMPKENFAIYAVMRQKVISTRRRMNAYYSVTRMLKTQWTK